MRWSFQPLRWFKFTAYTLAAWTIAFTPVAHGAAAKSQRDKFNEFFKKSQNVTVGEFWTQYRHAYPEPVRGKLDAWVSKYRNEPMPKITADYVKGSAGQEQIRMLMSSQGKNITIVLTGDEDKPIKFGEVMLTKKDITSYNKYHDLVKKVFNGNPQFTKGQKVVFTPQNQLAANPVLTEKEFFKLLPRQRAEYLTKVRATVRAAQGVYKAKYGAQAMNDLNNKYEYALSILFGDEAEAAKASSLTGKPCVYAGYLTLYGESGTCGGQAEGEKHFKDAISKSIASCSGQDIPCNPMVYGYDAGGNAHCIPHAKRWDATSRCNGASELKTPQDKKRIIESYLAKRGQKVNLVLDAEGKVSKEQRAEVATFLKDLNSYINSAVAECDNDPLKSIQKSRPDQKSACDAIRTRAFDLQEFAGNPQPVILPPGDKVTTVSTCDITKPGSKGPNCECEKGVTEEVNGTRDDGSTGPYCRPIVAVAAVSGGGDLPPPAEEEKKDDKKCDTFLCIPMWGWLLGGGLLAAGLAYALWPKDKKKHHDNEYVPPVATDPGTTTPVDPTDPITEVPTPTCTPPKVIIGTTCTTPEVVMPEPELSSEGGSLESVPGMGAGTRNAK